MGGELSITHHSNIITHYPITHFLLLKNPQNTPQCFLAPKPCSISNPNTKKTHLFMGPTHWPLCNAHRMATRGFLFFCLHYPYSFSFIFIISLVLFPLAKKKKKTPKVSNLARHLLHPHPTAPKPWILPTSSSSFLVLETEPTKYLYTSFLHRQP